jgi:SdpC family antimicrobial peptide
MWFRQRLKSVIAVVVGGTSLAYGLGPSVAWASSAPATSSRAGVASPRYDGESLFRGLFFRQGSVGQRFASLSIAPTAPTGESTAVLDNIVSTMRQLDPKFFNRFATGIQSGNRVSTMAAITNAQTLFADAVAAAYHATPITQGTQQGYCFFGPVAVAVALVLVLVGAGAVVVAAVAAAVYLYVYFWAGPTNAASLLAEEKWVNQIASSPLGSRSLAAAA